MIHAMSDQTVRVQAQRVLSGHGTSLVRRFLPFMGPAMIAAVAYIDPGNFATNIETRPSL